MSIEPEQIEDHGNGEALAPGSKLLSGQYEILQYLSSGGFGITYLARDSLNRTVVIKECFPEAFCSRVNKTVRARTKNYVEDFKSVVRLFIREAHALSRLDHEHVVGVHQVFEDNETAYMALDLVEGKDLLEIIETDRKAMSPAQVRRLTLKLLDAVAHVHSQDLLHRDISPDNILVDTHGEPVLIDFGAAREEASRKSRVLSAVLVVKDGYSPQEFYVAGSQQYPASDLYALAATLAHLISGEAPPNSQARLAALAAGQPDLFKRLKGRFPGYDDAFLEAIDTAMNIVPGARLQSAEEWMLLIDESKRAAIAQAEAQQDLALDQTVMHLVKSVNADLSAPPATETLPDVADKHSDSHVLENDPVEPEILSVEEIPDPRADVLADLIAGAQDLSEADQAEADMAIALAADDSLDDEELTRALEDARTEIEAAVEENAQRPSTPYARILAAAAAAKEAEEIEEPKVDAPAASTRMPRLASVPLVFAAYFFYAHTALQLDAVRAATVEPIVSLGASHGFWAGGTGGSAGTFGQTR
ncbi:MAG: serine/threonine-protein kinase [Pseudomonadota bacterium]